MQRVERILQDGVYRQHLDRTAEKETQRIFCRHHYQHLLDVARIAYILILEEGSLASFIANHQLAGAEAAKEVVYGAALLHDIGRWRQYETGEDHARVGAQWAGEILERAGFNPGEREAICQAIGEHRRGPGPRSFLGDKLYRADKLSRLCQNCAAQDECDAIEQMETGKKALVY